MPADLHWFSECPELKSVHLRPDIFPDSKYNPNDWMERLPELLVFSNLTHFSLESQSLPWGFGEEQHQSLGSLLRSSSNLESIILDITDLAAGSTTYSPTLILEPLGDQFILPHLHTFRMLGDADPDWFDFVSNPTHPLRSFLARNPSISDFAIGCPLEWDDMSSDGMDPNVLSQLLPAVKHLVCPLFLFEAAVMSKLALQLESVAISNPTLYDDEPFGPVVEAMTEDTLPNLRKFSIMAQNGEFKLDAETLEAFLFAAKGLEELEFEVEVEDSYELLSVLSQAENLRRIQINLGLVSKEFAMMELAETCPRLEAVNGHRANM